MNKCVVRQDLLDADAQVPIGDNDFYGEKQPLKYRWIDETETTDDIFQVWFKKKWQDAVSIDFDFI